MKKLVLSAALVAATTMSFAQVGVGTTTPDASAALDVTSTTQGLLPPRLTEAEMNNVAAPAEGLMVYCSDCAAKGMYVFTGAAWEQLAGQAVATQESASSSGETWMTMNLGAAQVATASNDGAAYGDLYQWGRNTDGHEKRNSTVTAGPVASAAAAGADFITNDGSVETNNDWLTDANQDDALWGATKTANDPCPAGYKVPTEAQLNAERLLFTTNDAAGAYSSVLKLPVAGFRNYSTGALTVVGSLGYYWSSTVNGTNARYLTFTSSNAIMLSFNRAIGFSVRCIKE